VERMTVPAAAGGYGGGRGPRQQQQQQQRPYDPVEEDARVVLSSGAVTLAQHTPTCKQSCSLPKSHSDAKPCMLKLRKTLLQHQMVLMLEYMLHGSYLQPIRSVSINPPRDTGMQSNTAKDCSTARTSTQLGHPADVDRITSSSRPQSSDG